MPHFHTTETNLIQKSGFPRRNRHGSNNDDLYLDPLNTQVLNQGNLHLDTVLSVKEKISGTREGFSTIPGMVEKI